MRAVNIHRELSHLANSLTQMGFVEMQSHCVI